MGLSDASWFAATVAILLGIYIGERILDIDFSVFLAKNRKKGKIKRMMEQMYFDGRETPKKVIESFAAEHFGEYGGFAQQYIFYYGREMSSKS